MSKKGVLLFTQNKKAISNLGKFKAAK